MSSELDQQYRAIGKIVVNFNKLDIKLNTFLGVLISDDVSAGQIITSEIQSFKSRWNLLFKLYKNKASNMDWFQKPLDVSMFDERDKLLAELHELKKRAVDDSNSINAIRNRIMHSYWFQQQRHIEQDGPNAQLTGLDIKGEKSAKIKGGKTGLAYYVLSMSADELNVFADEIEAFTNDLLSFRAKTEELIEQYKD